MEIQNRLQVENCNAAQCKTCIFGPNPLRLTPERMAEITTYLASMAATHICHTTQKTCFGALELQARILYLQGNIGAPTVAALLQEAALHLGTQHENNKAIESTG